MRRRTSLAALLALVLVAITMSAAMASSVHFKNPAPTITKNADFSLTANGSLSGLGNGDIRVTITGVGTGGALCQNPGGESKVPGQNPVSVTVSGLVDIPANKVKNGNVAFTVSTKAPTKPTPTQAGCPTDKWSVVAFTVTYTSATLTVFQDSNGQNGVFDPPGTQVLTKTFTFKPAL